MGTRAVVLDDRSQGEGFWVKNDGDPSKLGVFLRDSFNNGYAMENMHTELYNKAINTLSWYYSEEEAKDKLVGDFVTLSFEQAEKIKKNHISLGDLFDVLSWSLWGDGIDCVYVYKIKEDGVYMLQDDWRKIPEDDSGVSELIREE